MQRGNIRAGLPDASREEAFEDVVRRRTPGARIERIVSNGQASPDGFWYDQEWDEWVLILDGGAVVRLADPAEEARLEPGDWLFIPARRRHRVQSTRAGTLWLAVHFQEQAAPGETPPPSQTVH